MDGITELAMLFKQRNPRDLIGIKTGTIIRVSPLEIRLNEHIVLNRDRLILSKTFADQPKQKGDAVIIIPTSSEQKFYVIDKAVV